MLKYIRHQVLTKQGHTLVGEVATQMLGQAATRRKMCMDHEAHMMERTVVLECGLVQTCMFNEMSNAKFKIFRGTPGKESFKDIGPLNVNQQPWLPIGINASRLGHRK